MRHATAGFQQQQAAIRRRWKDSPSTSFVDDGAIIGIGVKAKDGKFETVLPFRFAMTAGGIATEAGQQRFDVVLKAQSSRLLSMGGCGTQAKHQRQHTQAKSHGK